VVATFPAESHPAVTYPFAVTRRAEGNEQAARPAGLPDRARGGAGLAALRVPPGAVTPGLSPEEWQAVRLSLSVATRSVLVSLLPAVGVAWLLVRGRFPGRMLLDAVVHLPLVVPPVVVGWGLLILFGGCAGRSAGPLNDCSASGWSSPPRGRRWPPR